MHCFHSLTGNNIANKENEYLAVAEIQDKVRKLACILFQIISEL